MRLNDAYPSKWLTADADVPEEGELILTVERIEMQTLGQGKDAQKKAVLFARETEKGFVVNKTNWGLIAKALGSDDSDDWIGKRIALYSTDVQYGADMVRGIRVKSRAPKAAAQQPARKPAPVTTPAEGEEDEDSDIPF